MCSRKSSEVEATEEEARVLGVRAVVVKVAVMVVAKAAWMAVAQQVVLMVEEAMAAVAMVVEGMGEETGQVEMEEQLEEAEAAHMVVVRVAPKVAAERVAWMEVAEAVALVVALVVVLEAVMVAVKATVMVAVATEEMADRNAVDHSRHNPCQRSSMMLRHQVRRRRICHHW